eukprot:SAG22_NODE_7212_length_761_cov_1.261329_1_plen_94_part_10
MLYSWVICVWHPDMARRDASGAAAWSRAFCWPARTVRTAYADCCPPGLVQQLEAGANLAVSPPPPVTPPSRATNHNSAPASAAVDGRRVRVESS